MRTIFVLCSSRNRGGNAFAKPDAEAAAHTGFGRAARNVLTLGFARRFATYKRADLLFQDIDRLKKILTDRWRPVQIIFAGKAHPARAVTP
jgi:glucan phosphorylase